MQTLQVTRGLVLVPYYKRHFLLTSPLVTILTILAQIKAVEERKWKKNILSWSSNYDCVKRFLNPSASLLNSKMGILAHIRCYMKILDAK